MTCFSNFGLHNFLLMDILQSAKGVDSLQIGHSLSKEKDFKIECGVMNDAHVEVPFSHRHFFYAVYWIHEGSGTHVIDFEEYEIRPDRIFFIRPEQVHFLHADAHMRYSAIQFTEDFMMPFSFAFPKRISVLNDMDDSVKSRISVLYRQLDAEVSSGLPNSACIVQSELLTLLLELERISLPVHDAVPVPEILSRYKDLIDKNFRKERQVQAYASELGVSPNYLNVLTRKHLGKSALEMINGRVILEVKRMLIRTDCGVSEIAYCLGFNELSYFTRFFKHHTGVTPLEFRASMNEMYQK